MSIIVDGFDIVSILGASFAPKIFISSVDVLVEPSPSLIV